MVIDKIKLVVDFAEDVLLKILRYRIHISVIYFFLLSNAWQKFGNLSVNYFVVFSFCFWHFALYLFDRAYDADKDQLSQKTEAVPLNQRKFLVAFACFLSLLPFLFLCLAQQPVWPYLLLFPFTFIYTFPVFPNGKRVKDFFLIKNIYSAFIIWSASIFLMLKNYSGRTEISSDFFLMNFSGLLVLTIIGEVHWDMRDMASDTFNKVNTLPVVLGLNTTKAVIIICLLLCYFVFNLVSGFSLLMMIGLVAVAGLKVSNLIYHLPPLVALYNFIVKS